jgi:hypothetical protein
MNWRLSYRNLRRASTGRRPVLPTPQPTVEHTERATTAIAESATSDENQEKVRKMCRNIAGFKLGKFDSIYDEYASL